MAPRNADMYLAEAECEYLPDQVTAEVTAPESKPMPLKIVWRNVILMGLLHLGALYGIYCIPSAQYLTWLFGLLTYVMSALGITAGAHRLWAHRSYKAKTPLRILLAFCNTMAFQNDIIDWARDHRVHHKFSESDADPHNAKRGFFFAHVGWLLCRKHPDVKEKGKLLDFADLYADPVLRFQRKIYLPGVLLVCFVAPTFIPWYFWGESLVNSYFICTLLRYCASLNATWLVNSLAHLYGNKPYDRFINPVENAFVTFGAIGEGFHNYHHTFPSDYSTSEYGWRLNLTTLFIDSMFKLGLAYDRKKMSHEVVFKRSQRTGDGTTGFGVLQDPKKDD